MQVIGLDSGSTTTKGVLFNDGQLVKKALVLTSGNPAQAMQDILNQLDYDESNTRLVTTGYGRKLIPSDKAVTEITCHARGATYLMPNARNIIDIGGQDCKAIRLDTSGNVDEFLMNDKCAAGTGRFVDVILRTLGEDISNLDLFLKDATPVQINSMCTVFAESEVIGLIANGEHKSDVALGVLHSIAKRVSNQFSRVSPSKKGATFFQVDYHKALL